MIYGAGAGAAAAMAEAIKASGAVVQLEPSDFMTILGKIDEPLVVTAQGGFWKKNHQYLTGYKGLVFFTKSAEPLRLPSRLELIKSKKISVPDY